MPQPSSLEAWPVSLLWPPGSNERMEAHLLPPGTADDLDLPIVARALAGDERHREAFALRVLTAVPATPAVSAYRLDVLTNLLEDADLRARLAGVLPHLAALTPQPRRTSDAWSVVQIAQRLAELEAIVEAVLRLHEALDAAPPRATALQALHGHVTSVATTAEFEALRAQLPALRARLDQARSVIIGVNLSPDLQPESAAILSVEAERIEGRGLLDRLLGHDPARRALTPLRGGGPATQPSGLVRTDLGGGTGRENPLLRDLRDVLERVAAPVGEALTRYAAVQSRGLAALEAELAFLLQGTALVERLWAAGLPACRPQISPMDERICRLDGCYHLGLALRLMAQPAHDTDGVSQIVLNDVTFDDMHGRVWLLTGPNRGGKTTYMRAVGLAHLLGQAGLYVPAGLARLSPIDALYTHFPAVEQARLGQGRLDEEAARLAQIFQRATPHSLILLNEVLSGTSTVEALGLAYDAVRGLRLLGARAIYVTHLHELAARVAEINATTPGNGLVGSLVAGVEESAAPGQENHRRTFRVSPGAPVGSSGAAEIAVQHGLSYAQLALLLRQRGLVRD